MKLNELRTFLGRDWDETAAFIRSSLKSDIGLLNVTNEAILSNSGKQLRPILSLLIARACSGKGATKDTIRFAAASELLHNATLLHDDVADESKERRGMPTVMSLLGGPASVLIGDFWLVRAVDAILSADSEGSRVIRVFSKTLSDLAEGEMLQLQKAGTGDTDESDYYRIIYSKTASLFEAAAESAAISVGASEEMLEAVRKYAVQIGLAFQIKDDMFDYSMTSDSIGKPVGIDLDEQKITMPLLGALASVSGEEAQELRRKVAAIHDNPSFKEEIRSFVLENDGLGYARRKMEGHVSEAIGALSVLPDSEEKDYLVKIAEYIAVRNR